MKVHLNVTFLLKPPKPQWVSHHLLILVMLFYGMCINKQYRSCIKPMTRCAIICSNPIFWPLKLLLWHSHQTLTPDMSVDYHRYFFDMLNSLCSPTLLSILQMRGWLYVLLFFSVMWNIM